MNLEDSMSSEISQSQKAPVRMRRVKEYKRNIREKILDEEAAMTCELA